MKAGRLHERVAFDDYVSTPDTYGGFSDAWSEFYVCRAQFIYARGAEQIEADALTGQAAYKLKIRSCSDARAITQDMRMRDTRRGVTYNIREIDAITDRAWVYLVVERGVAA